MPTYRITAPDGKSYDVTAPDGASQDEVLSYAQQNYGGSAPTQKQSGAASFNSAIKSTIGNAAAGLIRGAGSIGATLLTPVDAAARAMGVQNDLIGRTDRREAMDSALQDLGVDKDSVAYGAGKLGAEIAGTLPLGGIAGRGIQALSRAPMLGRVAPALEAVGNAAASGGFATGNRLPMAADLAARATGGAISGGLTAGAVDPGSASTGALIGGALPIATRTAGALGGAARRAFLGNGASPEVAQLAARADDLGIKIPADRLTNSRPLNAVAAGLNYTPFSGRAATEDTLNSQLNQAVSRTFGQDSPNVTQALRKADQALGGEFDRVLSGNTVRVDQQFMQDLADAGTVASKELGTDGASIINKQIDEILAKGATGDIDGQAAYNLKKGLDRIGKRNTPEAYYAIDLKKSLMGALDRSLGPQQAAEFAKTRQQYGSMLSLEKLAKNGAEGEISAARLGNMRNINNPELQELADIAAQFVKPREGAHGAAQRAFAGAGALTLAGPQGLLAGAALGRLGNSVLNSNAARQAVLTGGAGLRAPKPGGLLEYGLRSAPLLATD